MCMVLHLLYFSKDKRDSGGRERVVVTTGRWFSSVSSTNETDHFDITIIFLKVLLNTTTVIP